MVDINTPLLAGEWKIHYHIDSFCGQEEFPCLLHKNVHANKGWEGEERNGAR